MKKIKAFIAKEKADPVQKALANNCLLVLQIEIAKIAPKAEPAEEAPADPNSVPATDQGGVAP